MANYIVLNKQSQLLQAVITSPVQPEQDDELSYHEASIVVLTHYYKLVKKARLKGVLVSVGDLMNSCPSFMEQISGNKQSKVMAVNTRIRNELTPAVVDREASIRDWISSNPDADHHDLSDQFLTGTVVASAYLNKRRLTPSVRC